MDLNIIWQNSNYVLIDKPHGCLSVPSRFPDRDSRPVAGLLLQQMLGKQVFPCHRLDYEVRGLLLFALNPRAHQMANTWFERKKIRKAYYAKASHNLPESFALNTDYVWKSKIVRGKKRSFEAEHGSLAITHANCIYQEPTQKFLVWKLEPITGKSHQLRFEMKKQGMVIDGDALYGSVVQLPEDQIALVAQELDFSDVPEKSSLGLPEKIQLDFSFI